MCDIFKSLAIAAALMLLGTMAYADGHAKSWTLDAENSRVAFGSIKKDYVGEVHTFEEVSGTVSAEGAMVLEINLASVETYIDVRNQRMIDYVFQNATTASLTSDIDMAALTNMPVGGMTVMDFDGTLMLVGTDIDIYTEVFIVRLSEDRVMATTDSMVFLDAEEAGIDAGITKLMELADLPGIARASPVTMRLIFDAD